MIEVDQVISEKDAAHESQRCLNCCRICYTPDLKTRAAA
jgi:formate dehydrogenase (NADP+) beta subunit